MKAIVLSYDRYSVFRNHMMLRYAELWPDHPFTFRIPYQDTKDDQPIAGLRCEFIQAPSHIKHCVLKLLEDLDDEEWIYWCIDDKYPIRLDVEAFANAHRYVSGAVDSTVSGLLLCRPKTLLKPSLLDYDDVIASPWGELLIARRMYKRIWLHQFLRVKVIRHLFKHFPDTPFPAKQMDHYHAQVERPASHRLFVTRGNHAVFGESTTRGKITLNCARSLQEKNLVPATKHEVTDSDKVIGAPGRNPKYLAYKLYEALALSRRG